MSDTDVPESPEANTATHWDAWFGRTEVTRYARIRAAALRLFAEQGVAATSIRMIARAAGVSPGVVQHHFGTKDGVRDAVNEHVIRYVRDRLTTLTDEAVRGVVSALANALFAPVLTRYR